MISLGKLWRTLSLEGVEYEAECGGPVYYEVVIGSGCAVAQTHLLATTAWAQPVTMVLALLQGAPTPCLQLLHQANVTTVVATQLLSRPRVLFGRALLGLGGWQVF